MHSRTSLIGLMALFSLVSVSAFGTSSPSLLTIDPETRTVIVHSHAPNPQNRSWSAIPAWPEPGRISDQHLYFRRAIKIRIGNEIFAWVQSCYLDAI